jgi:prophage antirepressor-like protein
MSTVIVHTELKVTATETAMTLPFHFEGREVRFVGSVDNPEWVAQDVCAVLGLTNVSKALYALAQNEKRALPQGNVPLRGKELTVVNEPGLYRLIFKSTKPEAERFKSWVFHTVLPSIRKTGSFGRAAEMQSELDAARAQIALLLDISTKQASLNASMLARRGHQIRVEEKALAALARGQRLLIPGSEPIRTVERASRTGAALVRHRARRVQIIPKDR